MDNLMSLISKANNSMQEHIQKELKKHGYNLYPSHGNIMINFVKEKTLNYKELSKRINKSPQTMTTLVRKLVDEGLVVIQKDELDKRNKLVSLTEDGSKFIDIMMKISNDIFKRQYKDIDSHEQYLLKQLLEKVIHNFEE